MKAFFKKIGELLTDSNGDGDVVRVFGIVLMVAGLVGWLWLGKPAAEALAVVGFGGAMLAAGKITDPTKPAA